MGSRTLLRVRNVGCGGLCAREEVHSGTEGPVAFGRRRLTRTRNGRSRSVLYDSTLTTADGRFKK